MRDEIRGRAPGAQVRVVNPHARREPLPAETCEDLEAAGQVIEEALQALASAYQGMEEASRVLLRAAFHRNPNRSGDLEQHEVNGAVGMAKLDSLIIGRMCSLGLARLVDRRYIDKRQDEELGEVFAERLERVKG